MFRFFLRFRDEGLGFKSFSLFVKAPLLHMT